MSLRIRQQMRMFAISILMLCSSAHSLSLGQVNNTRFTSVDHLNGNSIWFWNFTTWSQCICAVLSGPYASTAIALNRYQNGSCQLFITYPITYKLEKFINATLTLFKQLPSIQLAPCCSNLPWLINRMNNSQLASTTVTKPSFLIIDDNNYLVALSFKSSVLQYNRTTLALIQNRTLLSGATGLSYSNGYYLMGNSTGAYSVYSSKNLSLIYSAPITSGTIREITLVRNNSLMLIAATGQNQILFYNVSSITSYATSTPSSISVNVPCGLHVVNDSFIYVAPWSTSAPYPVYTLIFSNNTWILSSLVNTMPNTDEEIFQTTIDSCGRLWVAVTGFGFRIFDPWGYSLLYEWPLDTSITLDGFLLRDNYELYFTNFYGSQILYINPNISQCTS